MHRHVHRMHLPGIRGAFALSTLAVAKANAIVSSDCRRMWLANVYNYRCTSLGSRVSLGGTPRKHRARLTRVTPPDEQAHPAFKLQAQPQILRGRPGIRYSRVPALHRSSGWTRADIRRPQVKGPSRRKVDCVLLTGSFGRMQPWFAHLDNEMRGSTVHSTCKSPFVVDKRAGTTMASSRIHNVNINRMMSLVGLI
ncbi:hypothetical protein C8Q76DRAFT_301663 [Earliella scabrosa]|nr:hypothetical protein C8Q76DRAFT_301663 [Earliella scabrosa]